MKRINSTISIIVPVYNEEKNLKISVELIIKKIKDIFKDYEILIIISPSKDNTAEIAKELARKNKKIRVIELKENKGLGYCYILGIKIAKMEYMMLWPSDNEIKKITADYIFREIGKADMIITYPVNIKVRPLKRRIISKWYTLLVNLLSGLKLKYYNGICLFKTEMIRKFIPKSFAAFGFQTEMLIDAIKNGYTYIEIPMYLRKQVGRKSNLFELRNFRIIITLLRIFLRKHHRISRF